MTIYHKHHIIPRHMGGTNDPENLVRVSIETHAELHKQLWEELGYEEDRIAWLCLSGQIEKSEAILLAIKNANTGRKWTKEQRDAAKIRSLSSGNPFYGKTHSEETRKIISDKNSGLKRTEEFKLNLQVKNSGKNNPFYGKTHSEETKDRISKSHTGKILSDDHKNKILTKLHKNIKCDHCCKMFNTGNYKQHITSLKRKGIL